MTTTTKRWCDDDDNDNGDGATGDGRQDTTTMAKLMAVDNKDIKFDSDNAMGDGATGYYGDDNDYGDGRRQ